MPTILELLNLSSEYLDKKGIESSRLNAELLLSHVLKCKRLNLYLSFDRPLDKQEVDEYRELIRRRKEREPLQYLIGREEFYGLPFKINKSVLIPRPETEILVETIITENKDKESLRILDIGTGSGNIAISLAKNLPTTLVTGLDISPDAISLAEENAVLNNVDNVRFVQGDILLHDLPNEEYDIIVSNPPYISLKEYETLQPELRFYEPKISLTDNSDGYTFYKKISERASYLLKENGRLFFEVGIKMHEEVAKIMTANNITNIKVIKDLQIIERVISGDKL